MLERTGPGIAVVILILAASCQIPLPDSMVEEGSLPSLELEIDDSGLARALVPDIDTTIAYYTFSAVSPGGTAHFETTERRKIRIEPEEGGDWLVSAQGFNSEDVLISSGQKTVTLVAGERTKVRITIKPIDGQGNLSLTVIWDVDRHPAAYPTAVVKPAWGTKVPLALEGADGSAAAYLPDLPAGKHAVVLRLVDDAGVILKQVERFRIYSGATTSGVVKLTDIGEAEITVTYLPLGPLAVTIEGIGETLTMGDTFDAVATLTDGPADALYRWYINGRELERGALCTVGSGLGPGGYRVDVTATTPDGLQAGSATATFQVLAP